MVSMCVSVDVVSSGSVYVRDSLVSNILIFLLLFSVGVQSLELWNMAENKSMTIPAHENVISALAECAATGMVASASRDNSVKLWK